MGTGLPECEESEKTVLNERREAMAQGNRTHLDSVPLSLCFKEVSKFSGRSLNRIQRISLEKVFVQNPHARLQEYHH
jgi:hypothetical protein